MTAPRQTVLGAMTVVRPATDDDAALLVGWHADTEVSRYWDGETFTHDQMLDRLHHESVDAWIVLYRGEAVGYLQSWREEEGPRRGGLDGFLVPSARGRGLMPDAASALARSLLEEGWDYVTVDPYAWNERAVRGWAHAGFAEVSRHPADEDHASEWVLMRFETSS